MLLKEAPTPNDKLSPMYLDIVNIEIGDLAVFQFSFTSKKSANCVSVSASTSIAFAPKLNCHGLFLSWACNVVSPKTNKVVKNRE